MGMTKIVIGGKEVPIGGVPAASQVPFDSTSVEMDAVNVQDAIEELFTSVANGKDILASAISDKGIETPKDATFQEMADNIEKISSNGGDEGKLLPYQYDNTLVTYFCSIIQVNFNSIVERPRQIEILEGYEQDAESQMD